MRAIVLELALVASSLLAAGALWDSWRSRRRLREGGNAQDALRASEEKFAKAFHASPDAILLTSIPEGIVLDINEGFARITGYSREEAIGRSTRDLEIWDRLEDRDRMFREVRESGRMRSLETGIRHRSGVVNHCLISAEVMTLDGRPTLLTVTRDISEQKRAEAALRASEALFSAAFHSSPDGIAIAAVPEGRLVDINPSFSLFTGYSADEALGRTATELGMWADLEERAEMYRLMESSGEIRDFDATVRHRSGRLISCQISSAFIDLEDRKGMISVLRDVTEKKRAEEALRASETKFAAAFHHSPDALAIGDLETGRLIEGNEGFAHLTGVPLEESIGKTSAELNLWPIPEQRDELVRRLREDGEVRDFEMLSQNRDGERRPCLISAGRILIGGHPGLLTVTRDISEQKRAQEERERLIAELEAKNAELERFTYTVSHDLKSPIFTIRGFLGFVERDLERGDRQRLAEDMDRIRMATDRMSQLLDELLELSRVGRHADHRQELDLYELAREAEESLEGEIRQSGVELQIQVDLPHAFGDRTRIFEVLQNLLSNAMKFLGDQPAPEIAVDYRLDGEETVIFVRDNGIGIAPQYQEKVFGLFERLTPEVPGTGIGLALAKRIIEVHGGRIWVESEGLGHGSTFCFTLPRPLDQIAPQDTPD